MTIIKESHPSLTVFQDLSYLTADLLLLISNGVVRGKKADVIFLVSILPFSVCDLGEITPGSFSKL